MRNKTHVVCAVIERLFTRVQLPFNSDDFCQGNDRLMCVCVRACVRPCFGSIFWQSGDPQDGRSLVGGAQLGQPIMGDRRRGKRQRCDDRDKGWRGDRVWNERME